MLKQTMCSGSVLAPSGQCSEEQPFGWNRESRLRKCLAIAWGTYIELNDCCLSLASRPLTLIPKRLKFISTAPTSLSRHPNLQTRKLYGSTTTSAILAPAHIPTPSNSLDGTSTHSYHIRPPFLYIAPLFRGAKTPRLQSMIFHSSSTPHLPSR